MNTQTTAFNETYAGQAFNALTQEQQYFIELVILKVIREKGKINCADLATEMKMDLWRNAPKFNYTKVTDHAQAGVWSLENKGKVIRFGESRATSLKLA